jgi:hypothetical protein
MLVRITGLFLLRSWFKLPSDHFQAVCLIIDTT